MVASVVPVAAALDEEQDARDQREKCTANSDIESPVEHCLVGIKADIVVLVLKCTVHSNANTNADSCNMSTKITVINLSTIN